LAYERENDAVREFLSSEYQESEESSIRSDTLWESWKEWWKINHAGPSEMPVREASDFSRKVSMIWGKPKSLGAICEWRGYKARPLVQLDDQEESTRDLMMG
jgi:phage/plasmid-associated DNA primase